MCVGWGGAIARRRRGFGDENFYGPLYDSKIQEAGWLGLGASFGLTKKLNICNRPLRGGKRRLGYSEIPLAMYTE